jgi:phosphoglycolate phosphatase
MMARAAGASAIGVTWGYHARDSLLETGVTVIDDFAALEPALDRMWQS